MSVYLLFAGSEKGTLFRREVYIYACALALPYGSSSYISRNALYSLNIYMYTL